MMVVLDEKGKLITQIAEKCIIDTESLKAVHAAVKLEMSLDVTHKNVLWQDVVAALNRRGCVSNELAEELIKDEWRIS